MTTYRPFKTNELVTLIKRTEIEPLFSIDGGVKGVVLDSVVPDYYLVHFEGYGNYWVPGNKLIKY